MKIKMIGKATIYSRIVVMFLTTNSAMAAGGREMEHKFLFSICNGTFLKCIKFFEGYVTLFGFGFACVGVCMTSPDMKTAAILDQLTGSSCITIDGALNDSDVIMREITLNNSCVNSPNVRIYLSVTFWG